VLQAHPHQLLRERHFSAFRVNWSPKDENLVEIARELNIGLNALLVVDDSPHECLLLRQKFPELLVLQVPEEIPQIPFCLERVAQLQRTSLTPEDRARPRLYAEDETRRRQMAASRTIEEYLTSLHMMMRIGVDDEDVAERIAQLTQRTNQFNLTTRRYTAAEIQRFMRDPDWLVAHFSLADVFGDNGLVGVALLRGLATGDAEFDSFLMSCRVIGRGAEAAFLDRLLEILTRAGVKRVRARYFPTRKNELVRDFWPKEGFQPVGDVYELDLLETGRRPSASRGIRVEEASLEGRPS
jgi:FkbH-like protein